MQMKHFIPALLLSTAVIAAAPPVALALPNPSTAQASIARRPAITLSKVVSFTDVDVFVTYTEVSGRISGIQGTSYTIKTPGVSNVRVSVNIIEQGARAQVVVTYYKSGTGTLTKTAYMKP